MSYTYTPLRVAPSAPDDARSETTDNNDGEPANAGLSIDLAEKPTLPSHSIHRRRMAWYINGFLAVTVLAVIFIFTPRPWNPDYTRSAGASSVTTYGCGNSSAEALAAGCKFDVMSFTWSQPACFDEDLMNEFLEVHHEGWSWWLDEAGEQPASWDDVRAGNHANLFVTWEYHLYHCTFMWKKMHRSILNQRPLDSYVGSFGHTKHCSSMLLKRTSGLEERNTVIRRKFPTCPVSAP